jgi:predicted amidohydrolase
MELFLSALQLKVSLGNVEKNLSRVEELAENAPKGGILLLPEMFCCGFDYENLESLTQKEPTYVEFLKELSLKTDGVVVGTVPLKREGKIYNTALVFERGKKLAERPKIKLFPVYKEPLHFSPGKEEDNIVIETSKAKIGLAICFEIRFCKITDALREKGAEIILVPAMWGIERRDHFKVLTRARAVETQSFLVASNGWGQSGKTFFGGASGVYSPWGEILAYKEDGEGLIFAKVKLADVEKVRKKIPLEF